jgi:hypothetical protein
LLRYYFRGNSLFKWGKSNFWLSLAAVGTLAFACTNGNQKSLQDQALPNLPPGSGANTAEATYEIPVTSVMRSNIDSSDVTQAPSLVDLVGDDSSDILRICQNKDGCRCVVHYTVETQASNYDSQLQFKPVYIENDLARCPLYDGTHSLPIGTKAVQVSLETVDGSKRSKPLNVEYDSVNAVNANNPVAFLPIQRYQCRLRPHVASIFCLSGESCAYDPFQSEHARMIRIKNYYTLNMGATLYEMTKLSNAGAVAYNQWECSNNPNPKFKMPWETLEIYSSPNPSDDNRILNYASNFYTARRPTGIFNVKLDGYIAPQILGSNKVDSPGLGYVALSQNGSCPPLAADQKPAGYEWATLWAYSTEQPPQRVVRVFNGYNQGLYNNISCSNGSAKVCPSTATGAILPRILGTQINFKTVKKGAVPDEVGIDDSGLCAEPQNAL